MEEYILTCCSTADREKEFFEQRNIPYVCFHLNFKGKEYLDDLGETITSADFYKAMHEGEMPLTSQVNVDDFIHFFDPFLKEGKDILHVSLSSGISGTYNSANIAKEQLLEQYPNRKIVIVDSLGASSGYGLLMEYLADLKAEGKSLAELYDWVQNNKLKIHHWFFSTDLTSYKRGGRISSAAAIVGGILSICPLMNMDNEGRLILRKKIRTKRKAIEEIVQTMLTHVENGENYTGKCAICHSDCLEDAKKVADLVVEKLPQLKGKISINNIGTVIGAHTGPGTVALFFMGDERSA
ncbi:DegV family protein [Cellulosilyticum ruminicola]|uniref:DegV family protein n=1 Tax=Cellulosilyticum ruminicola TaxID=425254 RepID=UPI0006D29B82|nr:DegV family protein [Cellulosilyticum ruminicola]